MDVVCYFEPTCPWAWVTTRWLTEVSCARGFSVSWRPYALALKEEREQEERPVPHAAGLPLNRVLEAARAHGDAAVWRLYGAFGERWHHERDRDIDVEAALAAASLPASLASAAEDTTLDAALDELIAEAAAAAGGTDASPTLVIDGAGAFGPVLSQAPAGEAALALWDAVVVMWREEAVTEVKRGRPRRAVFPPLQPISPPHG